MNSIFFLDLGDALGVQFTNEERRETGTGRDTHAHTHTEREREREREATIVPLLSFLETQREFSAFDPCYHLRYDNTRGALNE